MSADTPIRPAPKRPGRITLVLLALAIFLLFGIVFSQAAFNLKFLRPDTLGQTLVFAAISAVIFLLLVALTFVLLRTLLKLYFERQSGVLGSKFRTKMVLGALVLSFGPVIAMFLFSYGLMNRSIDKWFSRPVEEVRERTAAITSLLAGYAGQNALGEARSIAVAPDTQKAFRTGNFSSVVQEFHRRELTLQGGFAIAIDQDRAEASFHVPDTWNILRSKLPAGALHSSTPRIFAFNGHEYMLATADVSEAGRILVALPLPAKYSEVLQDLQNSERKYNALRNERKLIRQTYMQALLLLTVVVLFAATWFALFLSKAVTRPVSALAQATQEISSGRLDYRVEVPAGDELAELVGSFNRMAGELESNRKQIEASSSELAKANVELEERRRQLETILESIPTGVLSLDGRGCITRVNHALIRMFHPQGVPEAGYAAGATLRDLLPEEVASDLEHLLRKTDRMGTITSQMDIKIQNLPSKIAVTVASMDARLRPRASGQRLGYVIVLEDLSDLLKAQKQAAWREVARRVAHEIKNPLTPIALSADRIRRHLSRGTPDDQSLAIIHGCAETIAGAVETVRTLVDEFSSMARFPQAQPVPADINAIVESTLAMFDGRLDGISVHTDLNSNLPPVLADNDAIKRVLANLVDNAAEATKDALVREISISTSLLASRDQVEIVVADTGHGVTPEVKERLFLPYFSTKQRGTGLGLAIVSRIIEEHHGNIRCEENLPVGARFIIELPVAPDAERHDEPQFTAETNRTLN